MKLLNTIYVFQLLTPSDDQQQNQEATTEPIADDDDIIEQNNLHEDPELLQIESNAASSADSGHPYDDTLERELTEEEMASQLNPDAKEFVPSSPSPQRVTPTGSPFNKLLLGADNDVLLAQSPRKGATALKAIDIPTEDDFEFEIKNCPQEIEIENAPVAAAAAVPAVPTTGEHINGNGDRPGSSSSNYSYQEMNLKEAMHGDEKQEYAPEAISAADIVVGDIVSLAAAATDPSVVLGANDDDDVTEPISDAIVSPDEQPQLATQFISESDPMNMSFYNDGSQDSTNPFTVDLNAVHLLPTADDDDDEQKNFINNENANPLVQNTYYIEGQDSQQIVIQDTEFGMMSNGQDDSAALPPADADDDEPTSIVQVVQEMTSEVTSLLSDVQLIQDAVSPPPPAAAEAAEEIVAHEIVSPSVDSPQFEAEHFVEHIKPVSDDKYTDNGLSPVNDFESVVNAAAEPEANIVLSPEPMAVNDVPYVNESTTTTTPDHIVSSDFVNIIGTEVVVPVDAHAFAEAADIIAESESNHTPEIVLAGAAVAAAVTAATTRLLTTGSATTTKKAPASPATTATKGKKLAAAAATSAAPAVSPKPAPIKRPTTTAASTTAKPKAPISATTTKTLAASPTPRPRLTAASTTKQPSTEKKTTSTTAATTSSTAKKPSLVTNGDSKSSTSSILSARRPITAATAKTATQAAPRTTTATKPAIARVPLTSTLKTAAPKSAAAPAAATKPLASAR